MIQGIITMTWFMIRQPETLPRESRIPFSAKRILNGLVEVCTNRLSLGYTLAAGFMTGVLLSYLNCSQQIFQGIYHLGKQFPIYMALLALFIGGASFVNSRIVMRIGMRSLAYRAVSIFISLMLFYLLVTSRMGGNSPLWLLMFFLALSFFCIGILFGNLNAIAMAPLGHIAGIGSAVIGSLTSLISSPLSVIIGRYYNGTTLPLAYGFVVLGVLTLAAMRWADGAPSRVKTPA
jgi:DHA1 family bicyclomycin/chloramphenicol resistance-like MFS transporter